MQTKMQRFLSSIGLTDVERFDLSFLFVTRNPYKPEQVDMAIEKVDPWDYPLLDEFIQAEALIRYPHTLRFSYVNKPSEEDVACLFVQWYLCRNLSSPPFALEKKEEGVLCIYYPSAEARDHNERSIKEFRDLLQYVNYSFLIQEEIREAEEAKAEPLPETPSIVLSSEVPDVVEPLEPEPAVVEGPIVEASEPAKEPEEEVLPVVEEPASETFLSEEEQAMEEALNLDIEEEIEAVSAQESEETPIETSAEEEPEESDEEPEEEYSAEIVGEPVGEVVSSEDNEDEDSFEAVDEDGFYSIDEEGARIRAEGEEYLIRDHERIVQLKAEQANRERVWSQGHYQEVRSIDELFHLPLCNVDFEGEVFQAKYSIGRSGKANNFFSVGDETNAISVRAFQGRISIEELQKIEPKRRYRIRGAIDIDQRTHTRQIVAHFVNPLPGKVFRTDEEPEKRVELHLHTNMSTMDSAAPFKAYYAAAKAMGMEAIGLCDHGGVQSFPAAQAARAEHIESLKGKETDEKPLKICYGAELYMFDLGLQIVMNPREVPLNHARYCVFDTETTGLSSRHDRLVEFGGLVVQDGHVIKRFSTLINPQIDLSESQEALAVNHITEEDLSSAPTLDEVLPQILEMLEGSILVAHNAPFDVGFLNTAFAERGLPPVRNPVIDTVGLSRYFFPSAAYHNEGALLRRLGLDVYDDDSAHRADYDANALNEGWQEMLFRLLNQNPDLTHAGLASLSVPNPKDYPQGNPEDPDDEDAKRYQKVKGDFGQFVRHLFEYHITAYARNQAGIKDLFYIMSESLTTYMGRVPKTPRQLIEENRANLLIGSACFNGEIFEYASRRNRDDLIKAMGFYDFIEIQPVENYSFLVNMGRVPSKRRLLEILRDIVDAARACGKLVVATGDAHYVDPQDKIYRDILITAKGIGNGLHPLSPKARDSRPPFENPDQHFRSTKEMLDSFREWCTEDEAREFVIKNSKYIASLIDENIEIISSKTHAPNENLPHSDQILRQLCETNFHKRYDYLYGDDDPKVLEAIQKVNDRLQRELSGIIGHGYAVTYYIAHRLIKLANEEPEHFIVGSRGSVGSSFAATMAEITEVNPLQSHYHCPHCHYLEFADPLVYRSGFDLPKKNCPKCGTPLESDGQNIPFETFLGFHAEKVPDIDLNFEEMSQHRAHDYCRTLLGEHNVFRAGTIEKIAEKTAFGYVRGYFEKLGKNPEDFSSTYTAYLASHCEGVKRTTGQHPGGIVVIPAEKSVYDFTAVQHPADDVDSDWLTTHFDFRAMHDEVLKLDILGHVDPMAMRYYRDITGVDINSIPVNDPRVLSLFSSPKELNLSRNFLGYETGAAALPEFGTTQGMQMLATLRPKTFNDLIIISGLAHGTNVWAGNAEDLVTKEGKTINEIIGCRDEIMTYLISMGIDSSVAFKTMEAVRKGKKLSPAQEAEMRAHNVPEFYIESCNKIAYLFPRGHAVAYVTMAVRVAYFKLYYPLEFYAVFFSIRCDDWDIKTMIAGEEAVMAKINEWRPRLRAFDNPLSQKEKNQYATLLIALEMLERGYHFENIDLYRSHWKMFVCDHENKALIPPFSVIDGLGENAAKSICEAREQTDEAGNKKPFISQQDLLERATKLSSSLLKKLDELGVLKGLGEKNQMSLFDFI